MSRPADLVSMMISSMARAVVILILGILDWVQQQIDGDGDNQYHRHRCDRDVFQTLPVNEVGADLDKYIRKA